MDITCTTVVSFVFLLLLAVKILQWLKGRRVIPSLHQKYVLVTGCDSGFGRRLALRLDKLGVHVFACCLTPEGAKELADLTSECVQTLLLDVTKDDDISRAVAEVKKLLPHNRGLWGIVNNAGVFGPTGPIEAFNRNDYMLTFQVNILGMAQVTGKFLSLVRQERGRIVNTTSVVGRTALGPAPYVASKFAAVGFNDVLRREVRSQGITVHSIEPGAYATNITDTKLFQQALQRTFSAAPPDVQRFYGKGYQDKLVKGMENLNRDLTGTNLEEVVDAYIHALTSRRPRSRYVVGRNGNFYFRPLGVLPDWLSDFLTQGGFPAPDGL